MTDIFRIESKATPKQKSASIKIKRQAEKLYWEMIKAFKKFPERKREYSSAIKRLEESVFWAVKGVTTPPKENNDKAENEPLEENK